MLHPKNTKNIKIYSQIQKAMNFKIASAVYLN